MTTPTKSLLELATAMAQDLREYADAAEEAGERIEATEQLLEEFDAWVRNEFDAWDEEA